MNWKNIFDFRSIEKKIGDYKSLVIEKSQILKEGKSLQEQYVSVQDLFKAIENSDDVDQAKKRYSEAYDSHKEKVVKNINKLSKIEKKIKEAKEDPDLKDLIKSIEDVENIHMLYENGSISFDVFNESVKKNYKNDQTRYADIIVRSFQKTTDGSFSKESILLMQRTERGVSTPYWCIPGGHVEPGEDDYVAAKRELFEETNINAEVYPLVSGTDCHLKYEGEYSDKDIHISYYSLYIDQSQLCDNPIIVDGSEGSALQWVPIDELNKYPFLFESQKKNVLQILYPWMKITDAVKLYSDQKISKSVFNKIMEENRDLIEKANKHYFSKKERENLAKEGEAMKDGSFPIRNEQDLKDAIKSAGLAKDPEKTREWIKKRAKELGKEDLIPEDWIEKAVGVEVTEPLSKESLDGEDKKLEKSVMPEDRDKIVDMLKQAFCEECLMWYQYWIVEKFLQGKERSNVEKTFLKNAYDELEDHAVKILQRLSELDADLSLIDNPKSWLVLSKCKYFEPKAPYNTLSVIIDGILAEECAVDHYNNLAAFTQHIDPTTYEMALSIVKDEQEHLRELKDFLADITGSQNVEDFTKDTAEISNETIFEEDTVEDEEKGKIEDSNEGEEGEIIIPIDEVEIEGIEKGMKAKIGEIRTWKNKKYQKTSRGWLPVPNKKRSKQEEHRRESDIEKDNKKVYDHIYNKYKDLSLEEVEEKIKDIEEKISLSKQDLEGVSLPTFDRVNRKILEALNRLKEEKISESQRVDITADSYSDATEKLGHHAGRGDYNHGLAAANDNARERYMNDDGEWVYDI